MKFRFRLVSRDSVPSVCSCLCIIFPASKLTLYVLELFVSNHGVYIKAIVYVKAVPATVSCRLVLPTGYWSYGHHHNPLTESSECRCHGEQAERIVS